MQSSSPELPRTLAEGTLTLGEEVGAGAQGRVVRAHDAELGIDVAVKLIESERASPRFLAEARALKALDHPHVVKVRELGAEQGFVWFEMDYYGRGTLADRVRAGGPLDPPDALRCVFDVLLGLAALHHAGIVHRDIKPENLFVASDGRVLLGDLGIALMPRGEVGYTTSTGANLGTVDYSAPEQEIDAHRVGPAADLYGAGASLYFLCTGRRPAFLYAPDDVPHVIGAAPEVLQPLIRAACRYEPRARFRDARAMADTVLVLREQLDGDSTRRGRELERFDRLSPPPAWPRRVLRWLQRTLPGQPV